MGVATRSSSAGANTYLAGLRNGMSAARRAGGSA
eukprot:CAMPEP_0206006392 /NCGR_PEP_ID=MMETSP1464-20131121/5151_1 /ASSEMBLY_ACC=CAM_ASM_001124 /TAXON_ID=119497 /ORGANISM="Exanthemachrysis gayraliae, Strain RCC1523" /LENGTH=33 /DNA_ID= /DNA_START= /DNA_END= /DNA_ORIENTATION=